MPAKKSPLGKSPTRVKPPRRALRNISNNAVSTAGPQSLTHNSVSTSQTDHGHNLIDESLNDTGYGTVEDLSPNSIPGSNSLLLISLEAASRGGPQQNPDLFADDPFLTTSQFSKPYDELLDISLEASAPDSSSSFLLSTELTSSDRAQQNPKHLTSSSFLTTSHYSKAYDEPLAAALRSSSSRYVTPTIDRFHLPHGDYVDDSRNLYSSNYNRHLSNTLIDYTTPTRSCPGSAVIESFWIPNYSTRGSTVASAESSVYGLDKIFESASDLVQHPGLISVHGLDSIFKSPLDLFKPILHSNCITLQAPSGGNVLDYIRVGAPIEHLMSCTVWKGLSIMHAEILFEMHRVFVPSLEEILRTQLDEIDREARTEDTIFQSDELRLLQFNLSELIERMLDAMQLQCYHETDQYSADSLMEMMLLFFISRNCLMGIEADDNTDTSIQVRCSPGKGLSSSVESSLVVHVTQQLDYLSFVGLDILHREGGQLRIVPRYMYRHGKRGEAKPKYTDVSYKLAKPVPWLAWDERISGFRGTIPIFSGCIGSSERHGNIVNMGREGPYAVVHLLRIEVEATLIERHSSSALHLKRTVRARLNLKVIPRYADQYPHVLSSKLYTQPENYVLNDRARGNRPDIEAITSENPPQAKAISNGLANEFLNSTSSATSLRKASQPVHRHLTWKSFDSKNYDVDSIFVGHRPYHKANTLPGSPRKHIDEHFGLEASNDINIDLMRQDIHVYTLRTFNHDMNVPGLMNPPQNFPSYNYSLESLSLGPAEGFEMSTMVTIQGLEPEARTVDHQNQPHVEEGIPLNTSNQISHIPTGQRSTPRSPPTAFAQEDAGYSSSDISFDDSEILEEEFYSRLELPKRSSSGTTNLNLRPRNRRTRNRERRGSGHFRKFSEARSEIGSLHWQDPLHFDDGFFDYHDYQERRRSIQRAGAELFDIAQNLQSPQADKPIPPSEEERSAVHNHPSIPRRIIGNEAAFLTTTPSPEFSDGDNSEQSSIRSWRTSDDEENNKLPSKSKGKQRAETSSDVPTQALKPHILFYLNRYSPLSSTKGDSGGSEDSQGSPVKDCTSSGAAMLGPEQCFASSDEYESMETAPDSDGMTGDVYPLKRQRKKRGYVYERRIVSDDSGYQSMDVPNPSDVQLLTSHPDYDPLLRHSSLLVCKSPLLHEGKSSCATSRDASGSMVIKVEDEEIDPRLRREQAILWHLLKNESLVTDDKGRRKSKEEIKLENEVKLAVWESLRKEERRKEGSEATLGIDSNVEGEGDSGDDMEFEEEGEGGMHV